MSQQKSRDEVGLWVVVGSVMAAMFGVRGSKAHTRDFSKGRPSAYIIVGIIFTALFVLTLVGAVALVMHFTAS